MCYLSSLAPLFLISLFLPQSKIQNPKLLDLVCGAECILAILACKYPNSIANPNTLPLLRYTLTGSLILRCFHNTET